MFCEKLVTVLGKHYDFWSSKWWALFKCYTYSVVHCLHVNFKQPWANVEQNWPIVQFIHKLVYIVHYNVNKMNYSTLQMVWRRKCIMTYTNKDPYWTGTDLFTMIVSGADHYSHSTACLPYVRTGRPCTVIAEHCRRLIFCSGAVSTDVEYSIDN